MDTNHGIEDPVQPRDLGDPGPHDGGDVVDLNGAPEEWLARLPELGPERARTICRNRPFWSWADVERLDGFDADTIARLKAGRAEIRQS